MYNSNAIAAIADSRSDSLKWVRALPADVTRTYDKRAGIYPAKSAAAADLLAANAYAIADRRATPLVNDPAVRARPGRVDAGWARRDTPFSARIAAQQAILNPPPLPTTTIGSFPQTAEVRKARAAHGKGTLDDVGYTQFLRTETERAIRWQEELGLDVLIHGEFERNDMVQYFGEVQSYGSCCVLYGAVSRPKP